jgi:hypothetical protein
MSAFNTVSADLVCPSCGASAAVTVQFKYGNTWQFHYSVGDILKWGGNDVGERGRRHVVVDGVVEGACPNCRVSVEWDAYVHVKDDRIVRVAAADGEFDFVKAEANYIVIA